MVGKELDLPQEVWKRLTWFWGLGFVAIAIVNGYYVRLALAARENLFAATTLDKKIELTELDCVSLATDTAVQFCQNAQQTEASWVNFKLFGTMGLTFVLILLTVVLMSKHLKGKEV
ncbi:Intracellular septation protein IspA [uncultured Gammaproteobacteria bacterium]|nr:Intracellular septation protein IspA [uncultured Gammaproteobacteria bacterium]